MKEVRTLEGYAIAKIEALEAQVAELEAQVDKYSDYWMKSRAELATLVAVLKKYGKNEYSAIYGDDNISFEFVTHKYNPEDFNILANYIVPESNDKAPEAETSEA